MKTDFFIYVHQIIAKNNEAGCSDATMQKIAERYFLGTKCLFSFITSDNKLKTSRDVKRIHESLRCF